MSWQILQPDFYSCSLVRHLLQVMSILFEVESLRVRDPRNILQVGIEKVCCLRTGLITRVPGGDA